MGYQNRFSVQTNPAYHFFNSGNGVVTLCGSTKFFTECMEINRRLTFHGWIVLMCGSWGHSYHKNREGHTGADYEKIKILHYKKILISNAIVVVSDKSGYIGNSTKAEIEFCKQKDIPIFYFDGEYLTGETEHSPPDKLRKFDAVIHDYVDRGNSLGF
ncbi:MAG: hypothetical protein ACKPCP_29400 [Sphaerospermopsis kisseleviana]